VNTQWQLELHHSLCTHSCHEHARQKHIHALNTHPHHHLHKQTLIARLTLLILGLFFPLSSYFPTWPLPSFFSAFTFFFLKIVSFSLFFYPLFLPSNRFFSLCSCCRFARPYKSALLSECPQVHTHINDTQHTELPYILLRVWELQFTSLAQSDLKNAFKFTE